MPVFEQGYRRYTGPRTSGNRALAIAWENVRPRLKWWVWVLLFVLLFWPYLIYAVTIFMAAYGLGRMGGSPNMAAVAPVAFEMKTNPAMLLSVFRGNSLGIYWDALDHASNATAILTGVTCAGLLASDRRSGALQIYFARPVSRMDYLLGKVVAAAGFVSLTTLLPCLALWVEGLVFGTASEFTWRTWIAPLAIAGASAVYALWTIAIVLALSAVMKRPAFVSIVAIFLTLLAEGIGAILQHTFHDKAWKMVQPSVAIGTVTAPLCGMGLPEWANLPLAYGIAVGLPLALLWFVWWRVRAVEVVT